VADRRDRPVPPEPRDAAVVDAGDQHLVLVLSIVGVFPVGRNRRGSDGRGRRRACPSRTPATSASSSPSFKPGARFGPHLSDIVDVLAGTGSTFEVNRCLGRVRRPGSPASRHRTRRAEHPTDHAAEETAARVRPYEWVWPKHAGPTWGFIRCRRRPRRQPHPPPGRAHSGGMTGRTSCSAASVTRTPRWSTRRLRHLYSITYQALIALLFQLPVKDTQTGLKAHPQGNAVGGGAAHDRKALRVRPRAAGRGPSPSATDDSSRHPSSSANASPAPSLPLRAVRGMIILTPSPSSNRLRILRFYDRVQPQPLSADDGSDPVIPFEES